MSIWQIVLIIGGGISLLLFVFCLVAAISEWRSSGGTFLWWFPIVGVLFIPAVILYGCFRLFEYLTPIIKDGGFIRHYIKEKERIEKAFSRMTRCGLLLLTFFLRRRRNQQAISMVF